MTKCSSAQQLAADVVEAAEAAGVFGAFLSAASGADLVATLRSEGPFTLFAPTDEAFAKFPPGTLAKLMGPENKALLRSVVAFHFAVGQVSARRFAGTTIRADSYEGAQLLIRGADGVVVNGARVVLPDIAARNGVIHGIDRVLWPKHAAAAQDAASGA